MSTRRPPVAPKTGQQFIGPVEGQQIILETHTPSPRKGGLSDYATFGSLRPRSPARSLRPADVYNAAVAEVGDEGRGNPKARALGSSPASSPGRWRGSTNPTSLSLTAAAITSLSPRNNATASSILDQTGYRPMAHSGVGVAGTSAAIASATSRVLSATDEHRASTASCQQDRLSATAPLLSTPARKATSAPDSQSAQAQLRTSVYPWSKEPLAPLQPSPPGTATSGVGSPAAPGHYASPSRYRGITPPVLPMVQNLAYPLTASPPPPAGYNGCAVMSTAGPQQAAAGAGSGGAGGLGQQRRDSISSTDSHSPGVAYDSPGAAFSPALRVATLGRVGSPNSPSTPSSSSQPHTPSGSSLKPRPPADIAASGTARVSARKMSVLGSPELRRQLPYPPQQQQPLPQPSPPQQHYLPQQHPPHHLPSVSSPGDDRVLIHVLTAPGAVSGDEPVAPVPVFRRSLSVGAGSAPGVLLRETSQPGTPTSASRPNSGRALGRQPVQVLVDAVRSKDEGKLTVVLEALTSQLGVPLGLNEHHPTTGRTPLHEAVTIGSAAMVAKLLKAGADPNIAHVTQGPPLLQCAAYGDVEIMQLLLEEGADVNAVDVQRDTALHLACGGIHVDAARLLTRYGASWSALNSDEQTPVQLAPPEFMRLYTYESQRPPSQQSPLYAGLGSGAGGVGGVGAAAAASGGLFKDPSYGGMDVALSPERPSSTASSRPTSATTPAGRIGAALEGFGGGGSSRRMLGRPPSGGGVTVVASASASPCGGPPLSPTSQIDLSCGSGGVTSAPPTVGGAGGGANLRPVPPPDPAGGGGGGGGFRSRRNSASAIGPGGAPLPPGVAAPADGSSPPSRTSGAVAAEGASAGRGGRVGAPPSPLLQDSEAVPASPPTLQLPGGVRRQLSRGAGEGDIMSAFQMEDAEIVRQSMSGGFIAGLDAPPMVSRGSAPVNAVGFFPPFQPPPGLPAGPSAIKLKGHGLGDKDGPGLPTASSAPTFGLQQHPQTHPETALQHHPVSPRRIHVPEVAVIRFGVRLQVHGAQTSPPESEDTPTPNAASAAASAAAATVNNTAAAVAAAEGAWPGDGGGTGLGRGSSGGGSGPAPGLLTATCTSPSSCGPAASFGPTTGTTTGTTSRWPSTCLSTTTSTSSTTSTATSSEVASAGGGGAAAGAVTTGTTVAGGAAPTRQRSVAFAMPSFSAGVAPGVVALAEHSVEQHEHGDRGAGGGGVGGYTPVPTTGFMPPPAAFAPPPPPPPPQQQQQQQHPPQPRPRPAAPAASRASGTGDDGCTPPLMRDNSPVREHHASDDGSGDGAAGGRDAAGAGGSGGRHPERASALAAKALKRMSPVNTSKDAIEVRAANMFRQSTDLRTGEIAWTQGELLGEGSFGKVYAGLNQLTGELMAVKVLKLINHQVNKEAAMQQLQDLQREMSMYKKLRNKHVVGFIDARYDPDTSSYYIFLEYVPGGSISSMLKRFKRFSEELVRNYTRQLLTGLAYLHSCKIVHRDLKGGNVLVSRDGVVKLTDFGASKAYRDQTIKECMKSVRGSVYWMAPEVIRGTGYDRRADIWSLGCTVIEMLSGTHPWPNLDNQWTAMFTIAKTEEGPPRPVNISPEAARFLDRCLAFDAAKRPTAQELLQDPFVALAGPVPSLATLEDDERLQHSF